MLRKKSKPGVEPQIVGWKERVDLPELGLFKLRAKIDTGAQTSALHVDTVDIQTNARGAASVQFRFTERTASRGSRVIACTASLVDTRAIRSSNGDLEMRPVIRTTLTIGQKQQPVEITLTNRDDMRYPMLVGRTALRSGFLVNPGRAHMLAKVQKSATARPKRNKESKV